MFGRSDTCPKEACTSTFFHKKPEIVLAFAGDSTIIRCVPVVISVDNGFVLFLATTAVHVLFVVFFVATFFVVVFFSTFFAVSFLTVVAFFVAGLFAVVFFSTFFAHAALLVEREVFFTGI